MAHWLDPARYAVPLLTRSGGSNGLLAQEELDHLPRQVGNGNEPRDVKIPAGVEIITDSPRQSFFQMSGMWENFLDVRGTRAEIEAVQRLVKELDVPPSYLQLEAQFCRMSPQILKKLPMKFVASQEFPGAPSLALVSLTLDLQTELIERLKKSQIRGLHSLKMTAIDGLVAQINSTQLDGLMLSPLTESPEHTSEASWQWLLGFAAVQTNLNLHCTPIIQGDMVKLFTRLTLNNYNATVNVTVRDGETTAIALPTETPNAANRTVIFLTARIKNRTGDKVARAPRKTGPSAAF